MPFPLLYEINTRVWLNRLSEMQRAAVTLESVPDAEFERWRRLGLTHIWLMGVWTTGQRGRAEAQSFLEPQRRLQRKYPQSGPNPIGGSPYAIADYHVPEALGGEAGLRTFRRRLRQNGLKLILDFVPNHLGLDHPWLRERPDLFVQGCAEAPGTFAQKNPAGVVWVAHGRDPFFPPWSDTAQVDYRVPAARAAMLELLRKVAGECDGVRCDMAMLVLRDIFEKTWAELPPSPSRGGAEIAAGQTRDASSEAGRAEQGEFWDTAIVSVKKANPDFLFLAEAYWGLEERLQSLGFDYTYDKELYDGLVQRDAVGVQQRLLSATPQFIEHSAHFLENHDEPRIASLLSPAEQRAAALLNLALPGLRFLHEGQLRGAKIKIPVQFLRWDEEPPDREIERVYDEILKVLPETAVGRGAGQVLKPRAAWPGNPTLQNIILVQWQAVPEGFDLAAINLAPQRSQCYAPLSIGGLVGDQWRMKDLLGPEDYQRSAKDLVERGLYLDLAEHAAQLFHFTPLSVSR